MGLVTPNFDEVQDSFDAGEYVVQVTGAELGAWEKDGHSTPYVRWEYSTVDEAVAKNNGRKLFDRTALAGKGAFRVQQVYRAATGEPLSADSPSFDTEQLLGRQLKVVVAINEKGYAEVKSYAALG